MLRLKKTRIFKRSDIIPLRLASGITVSVYNVVICKICVYLKKWSDFLLEPMYLQLFMCSKVQQKWAEKRQKQLTKVKNKK